MERTNILHEFFNSQNDANETLEASNQERLEIKFQHYMTHDRGECDALDFVNEMCIESLPPDVFQAWEDVKGHLKNNRSMLKKFDYAL